MGGGERGGVCEGVGGRERVGGGKHALHVIQSVHMALYSAVINT